MGEESKLENEDTASSAGGDILFPSSRNNLNAIVAAETRWRYWTPQDSFTMPVSTCCSNLQLISFLKCHSRGFGISTEFNMNNMYQFVIKRCAVPSAFHSLSLLHAFYILVQEYFSDISEFSAPVFDVRPTV